MASPALYVRKPLLQMRRGYGCRLSLLLRSVLALVHFLHYAARHKVSFLSLCISFHFLPKQRQLVVCALLVLLCDLQLKLEIGGKMSGITAGRLAGLGKSLLAGGQFTIDLGGTSSQIPHCSFILFPLRSLSRRNRANPCKRFVRAHHVAGFERDFLNISLDGGSHLRQPSR